MAYLNSKTARLWILFYPKIIISNDFVDYIYLYLKLILAVACGGAHTSQSCVQCSVIQQVNKARTN